MERPGKSKPNFSCPGTECLRERNVTRPWYFNTTIYQIYPRSFQDSNDDGIGDIPGIISRLDYLLDLGIETIWFSPFFKSPQQDFGYDIQDYMEIAPEYGQMEDVRRLIAEVHKRGLKIVLDLVMNHTSDQHKWFIESSSSKDNPKRDWYIWRPGQKPGGQAPPNNWKAIIGGGGWQYHESTDEWYFANFLPFQPDLNFRNPEVKEAMFNIARFWLTEGVDGFRLDIFNSIYKDDKFRDNPFTWKYIPDESNFDGFFEEKKYTINHPDNFTLARELRQVIDEFTKPARFTIGEVAGDPPTLKQYLGLKNDGLNLVFMFQTLKLKIEAREMKSLIKDLEKNYPAPYMPVVVFSNHDRRRSYSRFARSRKRARLAALLQLTIRAVPTLYYGEELGLPDGDFPARGGLDPLAKMYDWVPSFLSSMFGLYANRDGSRTPMPWSRAKNGGFCPDNIQPWLPVQGGGENSLEAQAQDPGSLFHTFRNLLILRKQHPALHAGALELLDDAPEELVVYRRILGQESFLVVLNPGADSVTMKVDLTKLVFKTEKTVSFTDDRLQLPSMTGAILGD